jgi:DNA invertase Pin-like site-specific DNA recombinase
MKRCAIYARFSSQNQKELSIDSQVLACEEYAKKKGYEIEDYFIDRAISGRNTEKRLKFLDMIEKAKNGEFDCIITHKYDRFSRNAADMLLITKVLRKQNLSLRH